MRTRRKPFTGWIRASVRRGEERNGEIEGNSAMRPRRLPGGEGGGGGWVIWKCWSNISFRLDSAILLSASRRLPLLLSSALLPPKPSRGATLGGWYAATARAGGAGAGAAGGSGAEAPDRGSANTLLLLLVPSIPLSELRISSRPRSPALILALLPPQRAGEAQSRGSVCFRPNRMTNCRAK